MSSNSKKAPFEKPELTVEELSLALFQANQKLDQANKQLILQEKERSDFYANISHDLRSPMAAINSSVEYLLSQDSLDEEEVRSVLHLIQTRSAFLQQMINDIFTLSSLNSSTKELHLEEVDIGLFLEEFFYDCAADQKYNARVLRLQVPLELECIVNIDPNLILRVLDNLFTNALKYSQSGANIILSAEITSEKKCRIKVSDTGIGISPEDIDKVFERSYMVSKARTPGAQSGCGFGLAIAKSIIEKHGGTIWCESVLGEGSSFIIELDPIEILHE